ALEGVGRARVVERERAAVRPRRRRGRLARDRRRAGVNGPRVRPVRAAGDSGGGMDRERVRAVGQAGVALRAGTGREASGVELARIAGAAASGEAEAWSGVRAG